MVLNPGGGFDKPTDRDQLSWVFLNYPKNTLPLFTKDPKNYTFRKNKIRKNTLKNTIDFAKVKHNMIIQSQKTQGFCVADFAMLSDERRSRSKNFPTVYMDKIILRSKI